MNIAAMIVVMMLVTFFVRAFGMVLFSGRKVSPILSRGLSLVPVAVLSSICAPLIFVPSGNPENPVLLIEFWASLCSILATIFGTTAAILVGILVYTFGKFIL